MIIRLLKSLSDTLTVQLENVFLAAACVRRPDSNVIPLLLQNSTSQLDTPPKKSFDINEIFDGFLWGVPTNRRSVERRMMRKYGAPDWHNKLILPRKDLLTCDSCGHYHEKGRLCRKKHILPFH